jgi:hypothetical protein
LGQWNHEAVPETVYEPMPAPGTVVHVVGDLQKTLGFAPEEGRDRVSRVGVAGAAYSQTVNGAASTTT